MGLWHVHDIAKPPSLPLILVVDNDEDIRELLCEQLARAGFDALSAASLGEACGLLDSHAITLLLHLTLPDGDGMTFCRDLRAQGYGVTIMMLTARG